MVARAEVAQLCSMPAQTGSPARLNESRDEGDRILLRRMLEGENAVAFADFYRRFALPIRAEILSIIGDACDAEDVLQETFVHVWKKMRTYNGGRGSVFSWVRIIARSNALDRLRARQRYLRAAAATHESVAEFVADFDGQSAATVLHREDRARLILALGCIPACQRTPIILCFFQGMTHAEISANLREPLGTVKARIRRGLLALRQALTAGERQRPIRQASNGALRFGRQPRPGWDTNYSPSI